MRAMRRLSFATIVALSGVGVAQSIGETMIIESNPSYDMKPFVNVRKKYKSRCRRRSARGWYQWPR